AIIACLVFLPIAGFAQTPPAPPQPPAPGHPPGPPTGREKAPKVPAIFLGVETSQVPTVVSEQLGLSKGLGLVVEYVVPDSPAAREIRILSQDHGALKATRIDLGNAQIVFSDDKGEMKVENVDGKKLLTAKDPQGKLLFSGPVETKEDRDKLPADVRERYEK